MRPKAEIVTFKAEPALVEALRGVANRSEFIRNALLAALENTCPLCRGSGALSPRQREHWEAFARNHTVEECTHCHELHVVCRKRPTRKRK